MKKTQTIEIIGIGNFNIYPVTINEQEYNKVSEHGLILNKKIIEPSKPAKFIYIDDKNTEYSNDRVFTDFNGVILHGNHSYFCNLWNCFNCEGKQSKI